MPLMFPLALLELLGLQSGKDIQELKNYTKCGGRGRNILRCHFWKQKQVWFNRFYTEESLNAGVSEGIKDPTIPGYEVCNDSCHIAIEDLVRLRSAVFWDTDHVSIHNTLLGKIKSWVKNSGCWSMLAFSSIPPWEEYPPIASLYREESSKMKILLLLRLLFSR